MNKMNKSEVYSWRLEPALKAELEVAARAEKVPLSVVLERLTRDWLRQRKEQDEEEQERLRAKVLAARNAMQALGIHLHYARCDGSVGNPRKGK